jgi:hypothetical protein
MNRKQRREMMRKIQSDDLSILMAAIPWTLVTSLFVVVVGFLVAIDGLKIRIFRHFGVR